MIQVKQQTQNSQKKNFSVKKNNLVRKGLPSTIEIGVEA